MQTMANDVWIYVLAFCLVLTFGCERAETEDDEASAAVQAAEAGTPEDEVASLEALVTEWVAAAETEDRAALKGLAKTLELPSPDAFFGERWPDHAEALAAEYRGGSLGFFVSALGQGLVGHDIAIEVLDEPALAPATGGPALYVVRGTMKGKSGSVSAKYFALVDGTWRYVGDLAPVAAEQPAAPSEPEPAEVRAEAAHASAPGSESPAEAGSKSGVDARGAAAAPAADGDALPDADGEATEEEIVEYVAVAKEMVAIASAETDCAAQAAALETYWKADAERLDRLANRVHTRIVNGLNLDHRPTLAMSLMPVPEALVQATRGCEDANTYALRLLKPGR